jgi:hypothetical protein
MYFLMPRRLALRYRWLGISDERERVYQQLLECIVDMRADSSLQNDFLRNPRQIQRPH